MSLRLLVLGLSLSGHAFAHELQDAARGLAVHIETVDGALGINGLPLSVSRATGTQVLQLVERLLRQWRSESGAAAVRTEECCGWSIASRFHDGNPQVIQWRDTAAGAELLWSVADVRAVKKDSAETSVPLPAGCTGSPPVQGQVAQRRFLQYTARCTAGVKPLLESIARDFARHGWVWQRRGSSLQAQQGAVQAQAIALGVREAGREVTALVLVESRPLSGPHP
ncbi:MAG: hypothetical protein U1F39_11665 [Steroidobacteraceae bacterium]